MPRVFLGDGFRPLFLAAGLWAMLVVPLWIGIWSGALAFPGSGDPVMWHIHEMIFGYAAAALGGFLLTAMPTWTGRMPVNSRLLGALALSWLAGRAAVWWSEDIGALATAATDLAYLALLLVIVGHGIVAARNWRNLPVIALLSVLIVANVLFHAALDASSVRLSFAAITLLLALVGGRIVPNFTRTWLTERGEPTITSSVTRFDSMTLAVTAVALAAWAGSAPGGVVGGLLVAAGLFNLVRLLRWQGWRTVREPLVAVLHVGYLWLGTGLGLLGVSMLDDTVSAPLALHVLAIGAIGTMTLAVMTRAILGHTGRMLHAGPGTVAIYVSVTAAVIVRGTFEIVPDPDLMWITAGCWILAFALLVAIYGPMLLRARTS